MTHHEHQVTSVEVGEKVDLRRAETAEQIVELFTRLQSKEIPGFIIPADIVEQLEAGGGDAFDVITEQQGMDTKADQMIGTNHAERDPMHTDRPELIPDGATTRLHRVLTDHSTQVSVGRLSSHDGSVGTEYREVSRSTTSMPEMHVGESNKGDVTVFELSGDVAHQFSSPAEGQQKRTSRIRSVGPKVKS